MSDNKTGEDDLVLSGLPSSLVQGPGHEPDGQEEKDDDALIDEFMGGHEWRADPPEQEGNDEGGNRPEDSSALLDDQEMSGLESSAPPSPEGADLGIGLDPVDDEDEDEDQGGLAETDTPAQDLVEDDEFGEESDDELDEAFEDDLPGDDEPPKNGKKGVVGFLKDNLLYIVAGAVMLGYVGWQKQDEILKLLGMSAAQAPHAPPAPLVVPQADPLSPSRPLPAESPSAGGVGKVQPPAPGAGMPGAQAGGGATFKGRVSPAPAPDRATTTPPVSVAGKVESAPPAEGTPAMPAAAEGFGAKTVVSAADERFDEMQAKLDAALARVARLEKRMAQLEQAKTEAASVGAKDAKPAGKSRKAPAASGKAKAPKAPATAASSKTSSKRKRKTPAFTVLGSYMDGTGHWVAQVLIGNAVYELRRGGRRHGIRVEDVNERGARINGRWYP